MPWSEVSVMDQRREFVRLALQEGANRRELCRRFGISPDVGYKWLRRWQAGAGAPPPSAADGLDPVRSPVFELCVRSAAVRARDGRARQTTRYRLGSHFSPRAIIVLRMTISLRMQAINAAFGAFPLAIRRR